ncbi:uncharacterized protein TNCV_2638971 [Trichonephila clavipes]|nr:uncharacterized protein TNCV_2638971 [Trichonephila clavipes]
MPPDQQCQIKAHEIPHGEVLEYTPAVGRSFEHHAGDSTIWEVLEPVDPRDVIYTKTRFRTSSTDQSLRRSPHRKKCTRTAKGSRCTLSVLPLTPTHRRLEWYRARGNWTAGEWNQVVFSDESRFNLISDDNRVRAWRPVVNASILSLLYSDTPLPQLV